MNKHLKCVLKVLGTLPVLGIIMGLFLPVMLITLVLDLSGCGNTKDLFVLDRIFDWYKEL